MRILIVSPQAEKLLQLFNGQRYEFHICTSQRHIPAALEVFKPQLVLLDEEASGETSVDTLAEIRKLSEPLTYLVSITQQTNINELCHRMIANALLHPDDGSNQVMALLEAKQNRKPFLSSGILASMECPLTRHKSLSKREKLVLDMIWAGKSCRQIANHFGRSLDTVKNHRKSVKRRLGLYGGKYVLLNCKKLYEIMEQAFRQR